MLKILKLIYDRPITNTAQYAGPAAASILGPKQIEAQHVFKAAVNLLFERRGAAGCCAVLRGRERPLYLTASTLNDQL